MLGADYAGYFAVGDDEELARCWTVLAVTGIPRATQGAVRHERRCSIQRTNGDVNGLVDEALAQRTVLGQLVICRAP
jgi:hypothetical protein